MPADWGFFSGSLAVDDPERHDHQNRMGVRGENRDRESLVGRGSHAGVGVGCRFFRVLCACRLKSKTKLKFDLTLNLLM